MAEAGGTDDQSKSRRVRLMCPHPPRPFQPYRGPPVAEGRIIASFGVSGQRFPDADIIDPIWRRNYDLVMFRVDCAFDPYCERWITASVDLQVLIDETKLESLNDGPLTFMFRLSLSGEERIDVPYRRSRKSTSTVFCPDGNRIAWTGYTHFNIFVRDENKRRFVTNSRETLCGAFSPDGDHLALLSAEEDLLLLRIIDPNTFTEVARGVHMPQIIPPTRPPDIFFEDNPAYLLWSKCGRFLAMSTYFTELIIFRVKVIINSRMTCFSRVTSTSFFHISHPQAFDFMSRMLGTCEDQMITILAIGNIHSDIRLYEYGDDGLITLIARTGDLQDHVSDDNFVINCLRFSNAQDLLAVAQSSGIIDLLDSMSLLPIKRLQRAEFGMQNQPEAMPFYRGFSSLSFSCSDNFLAAGATDDRLRVWCVRRPVGPLLALCRTSIRSCCKLEDMCQLPVAPPLITYLTDTAF